MPRLDWRMVEQAGGVSDNEFWGLVSPDGLWLNVGDSIARVLGRSASSVAGTSLLDMLPDRLHQQQVLQALYSVPRRPEPVILSVEMVNARNEQHLVTITFYPPGESSDPSSMIAIAIVVQVRLLDGSSPTSATMMNSLSSHPSNFSNSSTTPNNLFEELDTTRHTSWQYELTHLRMANKNLLDDIAKLEIEQGLREPEAESQSPDDGEGSSLNKKRSRQDNAQGAEMSGT